MSVAPLLAVEHLRVRFGAATVVDDISFSIGAAEKFALVGESGSGKSITALSILRLVDAALRLRDAGPREQVDRAGARLVLAHRLVLLEHLADLVADRVERVQRRHRLLKDHRDVGAADSAHLALRLLQQLGAVEAD